MPLILLETALKWKLNGQKITSRFPRQQQQQSVREHRGGEKNRLWPAGSRREREQSSRHCHRPETTENYYITTLRRRRRRRSKESTQLDLAAAAKVTAAVLLLVGVARGEGGDATHTPAAAVERDSGKFGRTHVCGCWSRGRGGVLLGPTWQCYQKNLVLWKIMVFFKKQKTKMILSIMGRG